MLNLWRHFNVQIIWYALFSAVVSLAFQYMESIFDMNLSALAFGDLISSWHCSCKHISQMTLQNQMLLKWCCHYVLIWSCVVFNKSRLPVPLLYGRVSVVKCSENVCLQPACNDCMASFRFSLLCVGNSFLMIWVWIYL